MQPSLRYFVYLRKSTDDRQRQVRSLDEQRNELREIVERQNLTVIDWFEEKLTAKRPGRPVFNDMLARVEASEADAILAWHADRLSRNSRDGARIIELMDTGKIRRRQFYGSFVENTPQGKMMLNAEFGFSKYTVDNLSESVKRGHRDKIALGEYPGLAPLGYLNDNRFKRIVVDRDRAPLIRRCFEMYATGAFTLADISGFLAQQGILSRASKHRTGGKSISPNYVSSILNNPIYYGQFRFKREVHDGIHDPIISKQMFDDVQRLLGRRRPNHADRLRRVPKAFTGLLTCAECRCSITAEIQKGHVYYRCSKKSKFQH